MQPFKTLQTQCIAIVEWNKKIFKEKKQELIPADIVQPIFYKK